MNRKRNRTLIFGLIIPFFLFIAALPGAHAHCPLCTMGAMAAAGTAAWLGVKGSIVALFIGAFAVSMGLWISKMIKKQYFPHQTSLLVAASALTTILPIMPILKSNTPADYYPILISVVGGYGTMLNRTYLITIPFVTALLGGLIVLIAPWLSRKISEAHNGVILPFQGTLLTLLLLIISAAGMQFLA